MRTGSHPRECGLWKRAECAASLRDAARRRRRRRAASRSEAESHARFQIPHSRGWRPERTQEYSGEALVRTRGVEPYVEDWNLEMVVDLCAPCVSGVK